MALTVNSKPSGFQPVGGGSLIYQFTEASVVGKPNYRVELDFNGLGLPLFEFRPDASLVVRCDIAPILASVLRLLDDASERLKNTYVKYQAKWDGGSDAQVLLSGDVIYFYVGINHTLNYRSKLYISSADITTTPLTTPPPNIILNHIIDMPEAWDSLGSQSPNRGIYAWKGRPFRIDFLHDGTLPNPSQVSIYNSNTPIATANFNGTTAGMTSFVYTPLYAGQWTFAIKSGTTTDYVCLIRVMVLEEGSNPVYLRWVNDYGGIAQWLFDNNQELQLDPNIYNRYLTKGLHAIGVPYSQWLALNEINKEGVLYNDNYRVGQFLQDYNDTANPINIVALPRITSTLSKRTKSNFFVTVRYPEIQNSRVTQ